MHIITELLNNPILSTVGAALTLYILIQAIFTVYLYSKGIIHVWIRIGRGLSKRKVTIQPCSRNH